VSKGKVYRGRICRVFFAVSNTRQSLRRERFGLCRVPQAHGKAPQSGSDDDAGISIRLDLLHQSLN